MPDVTGYRARLGRFGVWRSTRDERTRAIGPAVEAAGFGGLWLGGSPSADLAIVDTILDQTTSLIVATGVVNIWASDPETVAASYRRIAARHPGRFILGIGAGHPESAGEAARRPLDALNRYLDVLEASGVPRGDIALAALGPRVLRLAAERMAGAHPYLVTPEHTRRAREIIGGDALLAPEQRVVLDADPHRAREAGRKTVENSYLTMVNYRRNLLRLGYTAEELDGRGSDRLIDDLVVYGDDETVRRRLRAHVDAGADHVAVQIITQSEDLAGEIALLGRVLGLPTNR